MESLRQRIEKYHKVLQSTISYRETWKKELKLFVKQTLELIVAETGLRAQVVEKNEFENLEAVILSLGQQDSGIYENLENGVQRHFIKEMGSLVFQQLYNGKIIVMVNYPAIDTYGDPSPPKTLGIYRPEEVHEANIIRNTEDFISELLTWEDVDDADSGNRIGFTWSKSPQEPA